MTGGRGEALVTPFVSHAQHGGRNRDAIDPLHTVTASRKDQDAVVTPFVTKFNRGATGHPIGEPLHTITSHASETHGGGAAPLGIVAPLLVRTAHGEVDARGKRRGQGSHDIASPIGAVTASNDHAVVAPILVTNTSGHPGAPLTEPASTVTTGGQQILVAPFLAPRLQEKDGHEPRVRSVEEPAATITASDNVPGHLLAPYLVPRYGERPGQDPRTRSVEDPAPVIVPTGNEGSLAAVHLSRQFGASIGSDAADPVGTITAGGAGKAAVVAAFLAQHNSDRNDGIKPGRSVDQPISTVTASGGQNAIVSAFLAQHNTDMVGHEATEPVSTIVGKGCTQGLVAAHLTHAYSSDTNGGGGDLAQPIKTVVAGGQHAAAVYAFLAKYYGAGEPVQAADEPLHTVTVKPRHGLVTVSIAGEPFVIVDIGMRMLTPRERFGAQGFRLDYVIDRGLGEDGETIPFTMEQQGRFCGNSVCPRMAEVLVAANYAPKRVASGARGAGLRSAAVRPN